MQHDASYHLWAPLAKKKWTLITTLDDYSRYMFFARLVEKETTYKHIKAFEEVAMKYGLAYCFYVDSHSIFRFVQGRDSLWRKHNKTTDEVDPQWKQVLKECGVKVTHALSPQAKEKIERPYGWMQDRLIRSCMRNKVTEIKEAQVILSKEVYDYNHRRIHSTTGEIPAVRFKRALDESNSLLRKFTIPTPFLSSKDIFCLRLDRTADAYRKISLNNKKFRVNKMNPFDKVKLRIYPINNTFSEVRFWRSDELLDIQKINNENFKGVHF